MSERQMSLSAVISEQSHRESRRSNEILHKETTGMDTDINGILKFGDLNVLPAIDMPST